MRLPGQITNALIDITHCRFVTFIFYNKSQHSMLWLLIHIYVQLIEPMEILCFTKQMIKFKRMWLRNKKRSRKFISKREEEEEKKQEYAEFSIFCLFYFHVSSFPISILSHCIYYTESFSTFCLFYSATA